MGGGGGVGGEVGMPECLIHVMVARAGVCIYLKPATAFGLVKEWGELKRVLPRVGWRGRSAYGWIGLDLEIGLVWLELRGCCMLA